MRAIEASQIEARRNNRNQWRIERGALDYWIADRPEANKDSPTGRTGADRSTSVDDLVTARLTIAQLKAQLEERAALVSAAETRIHMAEDRTRAAEADRNHWRELAEKLTDRPAAPPASPPRRWWSWRRS